jgi:hypothetical protein
MSFIVPLSQSKDLVIRPAVTKTVNEIVIEKVIDNPTDKTVYVFIGEVGLVKLDALSDDNYDNPQWNNESLTTAVRNYIESV